MKKIAFVVAALAAASLVTGGTAEAQGQGKKRQRVVVTQPAPAPAPSFWGSWDVRDPRLATSNTVIGAGTAAGYYAVRHNQGHKFWSSGGGGLYVGTSAGCAAVSPIIGTIVTQRELTQREVFVSTANCFVPIVGGMAMNYWFDYYGWDRPKPVAARVRR